MSSEESMMVFTYTIFDPRSATVRTGGSVLAPVDVRTLEGEFNRLVTNAHTAEYRYGLDPDLSGLVTYEDYDVQSDLYGTRLVRRAYFALLRYALRNPDRLNVICRNCGLHISKRCGEYATEQIDRLPQPVIGLGSLVALHSRDTRGVVRGYGPRAEAVTAEVIRYVQAGREA